MIVALLGVLASVNVLQKYGPSGSRALALLMITALLLLSRLAGLTWDDLGLSRRTWRRGVAYGLAVAGLIVTIYVIAAMLPLTETAFDDARGEIPLGSAVVTALVIIPLRTIVIEEVAFRGILLGAAVRRLGLAWGYAISSVAFGLWHVLPSLGLHRANDAVATVAGSGDGPQVRVIIGAVVFTALGGVVLAELRRRSGSLLAPIIVHWASNGTAVLMAAWLYAA